MYLFNIVFLFYSRAIVRKWYGGWLSKIAKVAGELHAEGRI